ncbi:hypothetical protein Msil_1357 [Methylocella silvestris BL2]|uniref:Peptidase A2 domain-containing protein n=1 Tax=Methylocella silvestris (strain DSM 15510 / CIP 108128 / LMG 27833 / NCIMB 13906 / BL2) TaxID=395965 RepID=B8ERD8_METSB|nr:hypothetical protein [Methylocella silvestris]ACK50322.1 hypothetical protein Msil_1357 [Methylocella silvestris BL2]
MKALAKASFPIFAIAGFALAAAAFFAARGADALCGGERFAIERAGGGASPYIRLTAGSVTGAFLLDYGATESLMSSAALPPGAGSTEISNFSLPSFSHGRFKPGSFERLSLQPEGGQLGVVGTDFLARLSAQFSGDKVFLGPEACAASALAAKGLKPIAQAGFFSSDPSRLPAGRPNVPVVFLNFGGGSSIFAQIDTGYEDVKYRHSVDINRPLFERLAASGAALELVEQATITTCSGSEPRAVYRLKDRPLVIESEAGAPIRRIADFYLTVKAPNSCGGIATMQAPAAQLGASFLKSFGTIVFDPKSETVWIEAESGPDSGR